MSLAAAPASYLLIPAHGPPVRAAAQPLAARRTTTSSGPIRRLATTRSDQEALSEIACIGPRERLGRQGTKLSPYRRDERKGDPDHIHGLHDVTEVVNENAHLPRIEVAGRETPGREPAAE